MVIHVCTRPTPFQTRIHETVTHLLSAFPNALLYCSGRRFLNVLAVSDYCGGCPSPCSASPGEGPRRADARRAEALVQLVQLLREVRRQLAHLKQHRERVSPRGGCPSSLAAIQPRLVQPKFQKCSTIPTKYCTGHAVTARPRALRDEPHEHAPQRVVRVRQLQQRRPGACLRRVPEAGA